MTLAVAPDPPVVAVRVPDAVVSTRFVPPCVLLIVIKLGSGALILVTKYLVPDTIPPNVVPVNVIALPTTTFTTLSNLIVFVPL